MSLSRECVDGTGGREATAAGPERERTASLEHERRDVARPDPRKIPDVAHADDAAVLVLAVQLDADLAAEQLSGEPGGGVRARVRLWSSPLEAKGSVGLTNLTLRPRRVERDSQSARAGGGREAEYGRLNGSSEPTLPRGRRLRPIVYAASHS